MLKSCSLLFSLPFAYYRRLSAVGAVVALGALAACSGGSSSADQSSATTTSGAGGAGGEANSASSATGMMSGSGGSGGGGSAEPGLRVLSLNLHCFKLEGTQFTKNADRFAAIASLVAAEDVDVMLLQEACSTAEMDALTEIRVAVEAATKAAWSPAWSFAHIGWEGTPDQADEGVGLLVRGALTGQETIDHAVQAGLRRVALSAALPVSFGDIRAMTVHFDVDDAVARRMQAREAAAGALAATDPTFGAIVGGDFNDIEGSDAHSAFKLLGFIDATAGLDAAGIDHIFIHRAAPLRPASAKLVFLGADAVSDHPGVLARLEPAKGDAVTPTRVIGAATPGAGHFISLRGSVLPLDWNIGWPMHEASPGSWRFVTTELEAAFAFKLLVDDSTWQMGPDATGAAGQDNPITPAF